MKINYNDWFYEFHKYLKGTCGYNDTNWVDIGDRYQRLIDLKSKLMKQQPYGVVGNKAGFQKLLDLIAKSNYRFEDIDDALMKTYDQSLQRAMGKMLVNTHAVIFHASNLKDKNIHNENFTSYYIADVPYAQLHFGERDEFIRQKLQKMHDSVNDQYIHMSEFTTNPFTKLLGFSLMCTINGKICNDFYVGFDDHGFRFKFSYGGLYDAEVIIYKLDQTTVTKVSIGKQVLQQDTIQIGVNQKERVGQLCIVDIYSSNFQKTVQVVPNFGYINDKGFLQIDNLQQATLDMIDQLQLSNLEVVVYYPQFLHEINGIYPATNYMNMTHLTPVYTDTANRVTNVDENLILASEITKDDAYHLPICTPPICIDRTYDLQFDIIQKCVGLYDFLMEQQDTFIRMGNQLYQKSAFTSFEEYQSTITRPLQSFYDKTLPYYEAYLKGAILTSMNETELIDRFTELMDCALKLINLTEDDYEDYKQFIMDEFYGIAYPNFVSDITRPYIESDSLKVFRNLNRMNTTFVSSTSSHHFNRPISEQCFITLQYSRDEQAWLFAYPNLKHFKGIENTFYVDDDLNGSEVFKFFVLYTDTFAPSAKMIDDTFTEETVMDYDTFITQVEHHLGFLRYWEIENTLMKLSKILYSQYDDQTVVQILSDLLRHQITVKDVVHTDWSNVAYASANVTSDNDKEYDDTSERAPFTINYLFYTLSLLNENEDALQTFFYRTLTDDKFNARYLDYNISNVTNEQSKLIMNFSQISNGLYAMEAAPLVTSNTLNDGYYHLYCGVPSIFRNGQHMDGQAYQFTFVNYGAIVNDDMQKFPLVDNMRIDQAHYIKSMRFENSVSFYYEIQLAKLFTKYLTCIRDFITYIETNYKIGINHTFVVNSAQESLQKIYDQIKAFYDNLPSGSYQFNTEWLQHNILDAEPFLKHDGIFDQLLDVYKELQHHINWKFGTTTSWNGWTHTNHTYQNLYLAVHWWLRTLRYMYFVYGYKNQTIRRLRGIYLYFKKFNKPQNVYQFKQLHTNVDYGFICRDMARSVAEWDRDRNLPYFEPFSYPATLSSNGASFVTGLNLHLQTFDTFDNIMQSIKTVKNGYLHDMELYVNTAMQHYVCDLYVIDNIIPTDDVIVCDTQPVYAKWSVIRDVSHPHFTRPNQSIMYPAEGERTLYFAVASKYVDGKYAVNPIGGIRKHCEYAFFDGNTIPNSDSHSTFELYDKNGSLLKSLSCTITFRRVGNTADLLPDMEFLCNVSNSKVDLQNIHEDMTTNGDGVTITQKVCNTNYELLMANRYQQLPHTYEKILQRKTMLPGSIDRVYISNQDINQFVLSDLGSRPSTQLFFKPSQIYHKTDPSVGGKYFEKQKIYITTDDALHYTFPAYITAIDHSPSRGFVEARVDSRHAKWFEITDKALMMKYLTTDVQCTVLDDNISNFLDEFSNSEYFEYYNPPYQNDLEFTDEDYEGMLSVPGDPVYVQSNASYVYTRVNHFFNSLVPDPYMDDAHKQWRFHYMGWNQVSHPEDTMTLQMLRVNRSLLTDPELYPILRDEPNDHDVKALENLTYENLFTEIDSKLERQLDRREFYYHEKYDTIEEQEEANRIIQDCNIQIAKLEAYENRIKEYIDEPEHATTWFNVPSYDAANVYIHNHRTKLPYTYQCDIRDIPHTNKSKLFLYDWEHKQWMDPSTYYIEEKAYQNDNTDVYDDYTVDTLHQIVIHTRDTFTPSRKILIYFAYEKSDVFDDITINDKTCTVRFKPILSTNNDIPEDPSIVKNDMYKDLSIRKHVDYEETYKYGMKSCQYFYADQMNQMYPDDQLAGFAHTSHEIIYVKRPNSTRALTEESGPDIQYAVDRTGIHSGRFPYTPTPRFCDLSITIKGSNEHVIDPDGLGYFVPNPFKDTDTDVEFQYPVYDTTVIQEIDNFTNGEKVRLICINNRQASYNGNISSMMFEGVTGLDEDGNQTIAITKSTLQDFTEKTYTCTIFHDPNYTSIGGVIRIHVKTTSEVITNDDGSWIQIPHELVQYHEIPDRFVIAPYNAHEHNFVDGSFGINALTDDSVEIKISTSYQKQTNDVILKDNSNVYNPYEFYYDTYHKIRYPISDIRHNEYDKRLTTSNVDTSIHVVRTNYINVCRYSLSDIPQDGLIDVTGYIPTPLSRTRYEFWVNGRQLKGVSNLIILSPTSFQLINLTSLKNFELIELVDDAYDNILSNKGTVYVDLDGNVYSSYERAFLSNRDVLQQTIQYRYNSFPNHTALQNVTMGIVSNPNNVNIETDIMDLWKETVTEEEKKDYRNYYNIPSINGVPLYHPNMDDLGIREIPYEQILNVFDKTWQKEITTNPLFPTTHLDDSMIQDQQYVLFHVVEETGHFTIYTSGTYKKYFSVYLSKSEYASIESLDNTIKIIPFIRTGTRILLDKSVRGLWLHATIENELPKKIQ